MVKPKDLPPPFKWENRKIVLEKGLLFLPEWVGDYSEFTFPSFAEIFGNTLPVHVEFCSGNGDWVVERAAENTELNWIAVEKRFDRSRKIWAKQHNAGVKNLFIVCGDAFTFMKYYVASGSVAQAFINFPDPWPKTRHAKHRLIREEFIAEVGRGLNEGGSFSMATDDVDTSLAMIDLMGSDSGFTSAYPEPFFLTEFDDYGKVSWFEKLWRGKGKSIRYLSFKRQGVTQ